MADVNKSVAINYTASTENLERALKKIPNITDAQANKAAQDLDKNFKKMEKSADSTQRGISSKMKNMGASFAAVAAAGAALAASLVAITQEFADLTNELVDASAKTGIAVDTLAGLRLAAEGSGLGFANLEGGLIKFQSSMLAASRGSKEMADTFAGLGVEITGVNGELRDSDTVFNEIIAALGSMTNETERNALAMQIFGRQAGPALIQSGALQNLEGMTNLARDFGIAIDEDAIGAMGNFQRAMAEMDLVSMGVLQNLINSIAGPNSMTSAIHFVTKGMIYMGSLSSDILTAIGTGFENVFVIASALSMALSGDTARAMTLMQEQARESNAHMANLGNMFSRASAQVDKFNATSAASTAPKVMASVASSTGRAAGNMKKMAEAQKEINELQGFSKDIFDETERLLKDNAKVIENSVKFRNDMYLSSYDKERQKISEVTKDLENQVFLNRYLVEERQNELNALEEQAAGIDRTNQLTKEQALLLQKITELQFDIGFKNEELADLESHYNAQRLAEYEAMGKVRADQIQEQKELEIAAQEEIIASYKAKIDTVNDLGDRVFSTFNDMSTAFQAINDAQISHLQDQMKAELEAVKKQEEQGVISKQQAAGIKTRIEEDYAAAMQERELKNFKAKQAMAVSEVIFQGGIAAIRSLADYGLPAGLAVAALAGAQTAAQLAAIGAQSPPKFDVGGMVGNSTDSAPDMVTANLLKGEAILDRSTVQRIGGEEGVRNLQNGYTPNNTPIIIQPFKHIDRYTRAVNKRMSRRVGSGAY